MERGELNLEVSHWNLQEIAALPDGQSISQYAESLTFDCGEIERRVEALQSAEPRPEHSAFVALLLDFEQLEERYHQVLSYVFCVVGEYADAQVVDEAQNTLAKVRLAVLPVRQQVRSLLRLLSRESFEALIQSPELQSAGHHLRGERRDAQLRMSKGEETLAIELEGSGLAAWTRLYNAINGKLVFPMRGVDGEPRDTPLSELYSLLSQPDPVVRKEAFRSSTRVRQANEVAFAGCLNGIAGARLTLWKRRGHVHFLDVPMQEADMNRETVDQMMKVVLNNRETAQSWLRLKAQILGFERLGIYDRSAPLPVPETSPRTIQDAMTIVSDGFARAHEPLARFARNAFDSRWVETGVGEGKFTLGFCASFPRSRRSAVFLPYKGTYNDLSCLAHELGHAFHNQIMYANRYWERQATAPMAETAALVAEALVRNQFLNHPDVGSTMKFLVLGIQLDTVVNYLLRIPRDYEFETALYTERGDGELSVDRLKELLAAGYRKWFGDALAGDAPDSDSTRADGLDQMAWAAIPHFYLAGAPFYNFPYIVGYLLAAGIADRFAREEPGFQQRYDQFLELTGRVSVEESVLEGLGIDLRGPHFWQETIDGFGCRLQKMKRLSEEIGPSLALAKTR